MSSGDDHAGVHGNQNGIAEVEDDDDEEEEETQINSGRAERRSCPGQPWNLLLYSQRPS